MTKLAWQEIAFLRAARDLAQHQVELYNVLTDATGMDPYDFWVRCVDRPIHGWFAKRRWIA